jgi:hypothetical protein
VKRYTDINHAKYSASRLNKKWLAMDASGELWAGNYKPVYHEYYPIWIWADEQSTVKIGWIKPVNLWRKCVWEITQ